MSDDVPFNFYLPITNNDIQNVYIELSYKMDGQERVHTGFCDRFTIGENHCLMFTTILIPDVEAIFIKTTFNTEIVTLRMNVETFVSPHHLEGQYIIDGLIHLTDSFNCFLIKPNETPLNNQTLQNSASVLFQEKNFIERVFAILRYFFTLPAEEIGEKIKECIVEAITLNLDQNIASFKNDYLAFVDTCINVRNNNNRFFHNVLDLIQIFPISEINSLQNNRDGFRNIFNNADYFRTHFQLLINAKNPAEKKEFQTILFFIKISHISNIRDNTIGNFMILETLAEMTTHTDYSNTQQENITKIIREILKFAGKERLLISQQLYQNLTASLKEMEVFGFNFVDEIFMFIEKMNAFTLSQKIDDQVFEQLWESYIKLIKKDSVRKQLSDQKNFEKFMRIFFKSNKTTMKVLSDQLIPYRFYLQCIVSFNENKVTMNIPTVYKFLCETSGEGIKRNVLIDLTFSFQSFDKSKELFLKIMEESFVQCPYSTYYVQRTFKLLYELNNFYIPIETNRLYETISKSHERFEIMKKFFFYKNYTIENYSTIVKQEFKENFSNDYFSDYLFYVMNLKWKTEVQEEDPYMEDEDNDSGNFEMGLERNTKKRKEFLYNDRGHGIRGFRELGGYGGYGGYGGFGGYGGYRGYGGFGRDFSYNFKRVKSVFIERDPNPEYFLNRIQIEAVTEKNQELYKYISLLLNQQFMDSIYQTISNEYFLNSVLSLLDSEEKTFYETNLTVENSKKIPRLKYLGQIFTDKYNLILSGMIKMRDFETYLGGKTKESKNIESFFKTLYSRINGKQPPEMKYKILNIQLRKDDIMHFKDILNQMCKYCSDWSKYENNIQFLLYSKEITVSMFMENDWFGWHWKRYRSLSMLMTNYCYIFDIHFFDTLSEMGEVTERLNSVLSTLNKVKEKIQAFKKNYKNKTPTELHALFGSDNENKILEVKEFFIDFQDSEENKFYKILYFCLEKKYFFQYFETYRIFVSVLNFELKNNQNNLDIISRLEILKESDSLEKYGAILNQLEENLDPLEIMPDLGYSMNDFKHFPATIEFIDDSKDSYEFMKEFVNEVEDFEIRWDDINNLETIDLFQQRWKKEGKGLKTLNDLSILLKKLEVNEFSNIIKTMKHCFKILPELKKFKQDINTDSDTKIKFVRKVMNKSSIEFKVLKKFNVAIKTDSEPKDYTFENLSEIRNMIKMKSMINDKNVTEEQKKDIQMCFGFLKFFQHLESIRASVEYLITMGYAFEVDFAIKLNIENQSLNEIENQQKHWEAVSIHFGQNLSRAYCDSYLGTFLHGKLFAKFHRIFMKKRPELEDFFYLKMLGFKESENFNSEYQKNIKAKHNLEIPLFLIEFLGREVAKRSKFNQKKDFDRNFKVSRNLILQVNCEKGNIYRKIIAISQSTNRKMPSMHNIFFCPTDQKLSSVTAFIHRIFACPCNETFIMVKPEILSFEMQQKVINIIGKLTEEFNERKSYFFILTEERQCLLIQHLTEVKLTKLFSLDEKYYEEEIDKNFKEHVGKVKFVISEKAMSGKTYFIEKVYFQRFPEYSAKKVTISGEFPKKKIISSLNEFFQIKNLFLHIHVEQIIPERLAELDEFFFSLFIFKSINFDGPLSWTMVHCPNNIVIAIEFDSSKLQNAYKGLLMTKFPVEIENVHENVDKMIPNFRREFLFTKAVFTKKYNEFNLQASKPEFTPQELKEWKNMTLTEVVGKNKHYKRVQVDMFSKILNFVTNMFVTLPADVSQGVVYTAIFKMAVSLSHSGINRIKGKQEAATDIMFDQSMMQIEKQLSTDSYLSFAKQKSISPWNNDEILLYLWIDKKEIIAFKDINKVPKSLLEHVRTKSQELKATTHKNLAKQLMKLMIKNESKSICPECLKFFEGRMNCPTCKIESIETKGKEKDPKVKPCQLIFKSDDDKYVEAIEKEYTITPDNYMKIISVYIRAKARLPVVIMGETGCGKTSLIRFLTNKVLNDKYKIFCVHAGVDEEKIILEMEILTREAGRTPSIDYWFIFDEFNTSPASGLIKSIMLTRHFSTKHLPSNVIFIATCNPYTLKNEVICEEEAVGLKKKLMKTEHSQYKLLYTVYPIPDTLLFYTFDFGSLPKNDERKYLLIWLEKEINRNVNFCSKLADLISDLHDEIKNYFGQSAVSLRDMKRFILIFKFFNNRYFLIKGEDVSNSNKIIILTILLCYYVRISVQYKRDAIIKKIASHLELTMDHVQQIFEEELKFFVDQLQLEKGIVKNQALSENLFVMFVCVLTKVPLLICGKPGSSKSLSVQTLFSRMKGPKSPYEFFRNFEELILIPYQGSEYSTSRGVERVFEKAENTTKANSKDGNQKIPVVVFDEIGLAEISKNNPLKVLHFKLELENIKVSFVGISNWQLDSSKMNRVLCLSRRDPSEEELCITAKDISTSILRSNLDLLTPKFQSLAKVFYQIYSNSNTETENLYGLRDFYHLIKTAALGFEEAVNQKLIETRVDFNKMLYKIILQSIMRNFNYSDKFWKDIWGTFCNRNIDDKDHWQEIPHPTLDTLILKNLSEDNSRFLMVITNQAEIHSHIYKILESNDQGLARDYKVLIGSKFEKDLSSESFCSHAINQVIMYMEQDVVLVIHQFDKIFTSLYDLFNQNYRRHGDKNYCRVIQSSYAKSSHIVNDRFKVIVFLTEAELKMADIPLINRFEKYFLKENNCFFEGYQLYKQYIEEYIEDLFGEVAKNQSELKKYIGNYSHNSHFEWVTKLEQMCNKSKNKRVVLDALEEMLQSICNLKVVSKVSNPHKNIDSTVLLETLLHKKSMVLENLMNLQGKGENSTFSIIYTFTGQHLSLQKALGAYQYQELILSTINEERELVSSIQKFFLTSANDNLLIMVNAKKEVQHMYSLQNLVMSLSNESNTKKHIYIIIGYRQNSIHECESFYVCRGWDTFFIDNLVDAPSEFVCQVIREPDLQNSLQGFRENYIKKFDHFVDYVIGEMRFHHHDDSILERTNTYYKNFTQNYGELIVLKLTDYIFSNCMSNRHLVSSNNIFELIDKNKNIVSDCQTYADNILRGLNMILEEKLHQAIAWIESEMLISSLMFAKRRKDQKLVEYWANLFETFVPNLVNQETKLEVFHRLNFPFSFAESNALEKFWEDSRDSQNIDKDESLADEVFEDFLKKGNIFKVKKAELNEWPETWVAYLLSDLMYLKFQKRNEFAITTEDILDILLIIFKGRIVKLLKYFILNPYLTTTSILLMHSFRNIFKSKLGIIAKEALIESQEITSLEEFMRKINNYFIAYCIQKQSIQHFAEKLRTEYFKIFRIMNEVEEVTGKKLENVPQFMFWVEYVNIILSTGKVKSLDAALNKLNFNFKEIFKNPTHGRNIWEQLKKIKKEQDFLSQLNDFKVMFYKNFIKSLDSHNVDNFIKIYEDIFDQVEGNEGFYLHSKDLISKFAVISEIQINFQRYWADPSKFKSNPKLDILDRLVKKGCDRLAQLIINELMISIPYGQEISHIFTMSENFVKSIFTAAKNIDPIKLSSLNDVFTIAALKMLLDTFVIKLKNQEFGSNLQKWISNQIQLGDGKTKSMHMYIIKKIGGLKELNKLKNNDPVLLTYLNDDSLKIANIECSLPDNIFFLETEKIINGLISIQQKTEKLLDLISQAKNENDFFGFYISLINQCQIFHQWREAAKKEFLASLKSKKQKWTGALTDLGVKFLENLFTDFPEAPILKSDGNVLPEVMKKNINILAMFAMWLSHKIGDTFLSTYLFKKGKSVENFDQHFKSLHLPGMIHPGTDILGYISLLYKPDKTNLRYNVVYQCNANCNFFYGFENCQQANSQQGYIPKCIICGRSLGAMQEHGKLFEGQLRYQGDTAMNKFNELFDEHNNNYKKGYFNFDKDLANHNEYDRMISYKAFLFFNLMTNSALLVLSSLGYEEDIKKLIGEPVQNLIVRDALYSKIGQVYGKFSILTNETSVFINGIINDIFSVKVKKRNTIGLREFYEFVKAIDDQILSKSFKNPFETIRFYKNNVQKLSIDRKNANPLISIIDEVDKSQASFNNFSLIKHLRLSSKSVHSYEFFEAFKERVEEYAPIFPITNYVIQNIGDLQNIKLILIFKRFYDPLYEKLQKVSQNDAENKKILDYIEDFPEIEENFREFMTAWNKIVETVRSVQLECDEIQLHPIKEDSVLGRILPSNSNNTLSSDIFIAFNVFLDHQNKMVKTLLSKLLKKEEEKPQSFFWRHVSSKTLFSFEEKELEKLIVGDCVKYHCDYGDLGYYEFNYGKFERFMVKKIFELNTFAFNLIPSFSFEIEYSQIEEYLIKLQASNIQKPFLKEEEDKYNHALNPVHFPNSNNYVSEIWGLFEKLILPKAVHLTFDTIDQTLGDFYKNSVSNETQKSLPEHLEGLPMCQIYSFVLLLELHLFKIYFEDVEIPQTRLYTDMNSSEWTSVSNSFIEDVRRCEVFSKCPNQIVKALSRLTLRCTYNKYGINYPLNDLLLYTAHCWDLDISDDDVDNIKINSDIQLGHLYLALEQFRLERKRALKSNMNKNMNWVNIDIEDR